MTAYPWAQIWLMYFCCLERWFYVRSAKGGYLIMYKREDRGHLPVHEWRPCWTTPFSHVALTQVWTDKDSSWTLFPGSRTIIIFRSVLG
ncbi:hypothetical protein BKA57DRAFT_157766 [Linnemannia elongata]|nr:hypothetical protein BKA57DRAFT_157766 [Linnemannia elongata]